jgi:hypothetical protein
LKIASWATRSENVESYGNCFPSIFKAINEVRMIGENFTSADLDIIVFECDKVYDPASMDDAYGDDRQSRDKRAPEPIVGTTGIGLAKITAERSANLKDVLQFQILIPAKVVLTSTLNEALEPQAVTVQSNTTTSSSTWVRKLKKKPPVENFKVDGASQDGRD